MSIDYGIIPVSFGENQEKGLADDHALKRGREIRGLQGFINPSFFLNHLYQYQFCALYGVMEFSPEIKAPFRLQENED